MTYSEVENVTGFVGNFNVKIVKRARFVEEKECTACGDCHEAFPECVRFNPGLDHRAPTCMRYPQATPQAFSIDMEKCEDPEALAKSCPAGARYMVRKDAPVRRKARYGIPYLY